VPLTENIAAAEEFIAHGVKFLSSFCAPDGMSVITRLKGYLADMA
jgi:hypothetical protein